MLQNMFGTGQQASVQPPSNIDQPPPPSDNNAVEAERRRRLKARQKMLSESH